MYMYHNILYSKSFLHAQEYDFNKSINTLEETELREHNVSSSWALLSAALHTNNRERI